MIPEHTKALLVQGVQALGLSLDEAQIVRLLDYLRLVQKWNTKFNLVGTSDSEKLLYKHILDSLSIAKHVIHSPVFDVGSGAGLPGIPLAITLPNISFTLIDSNGKKARFMRQAVIELKLDNVEVVHQSVTDFKPDQAANTVLARAFRQIEDVLEVLIDVCVPGGYMLVMLGKRPHEIPFVAGITRCVTHNLQVPGLETPERHLLVATKVQ